MAEEPQDQSQQSQSPDPASEVAQAGQDVARAARSGNAYLAAAQLLTSKTGRKAIIIIIVSVIVVIILIVAFIFMVLAAIFGGVSVKDQEFVTRTKELVSINLTAEVCDNDGQNCTANLKNVSGEKLIKVIATVTPNTSRAIRNFRVRASFPQGRGEIDNSYLKLAISSNTFFDSSSSVEANKVKPFQVTCSGTPSVNDICFGLDSLSEPTTFIYTVKTRPSLAEDSVIITEVTVNGYTEGFAGNVDLQDVFQRGSRIGTLKSQRLADLFNEVGEASGVPSCALAGIAAIESADFFFNALDSHDAFTTGLRVTSVNHAVGIMQVSTPGPGDIGLSMSALRKGAAMAGRALDDMLANQYDMKTNIFFGAGYLQEKIGRGEWTNPADLERTGRGYYGACAYNGGNYCTEFRDNVLKCEANNPSTALKVNTNQKEDRASTPSP